MHSSARKVNDANLHRHHDHLERRILGKRCMPVGKFHNGDAKRPDVRTQVIQALLQDTCLMRVTSLVTPIRTRVHAACTRHT